MTLDAKIDSLLALGLIGGGVTDEELIKIRTAIESLQEDSETIQDVIDVLDVLLNSQDADNNLLVKAIDNKARAAVPVTPDDAADLPDGVTNGIYISGKADLEVTLSDMADGESVVFTDLSGGSVQPLSVKRVWAAGTTATNILAIY